MSEMNPGYADDQHAGDVGARRATVGTPTDHESVNVPPTRPGAAENAQEAEAARQADETFIPEPPQVDDRTDAVKSRAVEEDSLSGGTPEHMPEETNPERAATAQPTPPTRPTHSTRSTQPATSSREPAGHPHGRHGRETADGDEDDEGRVRRDIEEARRELGETVEALAHKVDVKSRAAEAAESAKEKAATLVGTARTRATEVTGTAKAKAGELTSTAKGKATEVTGKVREVTPEPARKRPVLVIAAVGAVAFILVRRVMRRTRST